MTKPVSGAKGIYVLYVFSESPERSNTWTTVFNKEDRPCLFASVDVQLGGAAVRSESSVDWFPASKPLVDSILYSCKYGVDRKLDSV